MCPILTFKIQPVFFFPSGAGVLYPDICVNKREITPLCQRGVPQAQLAAACSDLSPVCLISPTKRDMMRAAVRRMSRCSPRPTGYCHPDIPPLCRRRPLLPQMEERNGKNTWRCPSQSADSEAGYWRRTHVCHCEAEHHLLRACCDENKGRRGRRGTRRGEVVWLGTEGGRMWHYY